MCVVIATGEDRQDSATAAAAAAPQPRISAWRAGCRTGSDKEHASEPTISYQGQHFMPLQHFRQLQRTVCSSRPPAAQDRLRGARTTAMQS